MGCTSSRADTTVLPEGASRSGNRAVYQRRPSRRLLRFLTVPTPTTSYNAGNTSVTLSTEFSNTTAEIFIIRGGIFIVTGNRVISFTMHPNQQQRRQQQQQFSDTFAHIASRVRSDSIHQFYLESVELRQLQDNLLRLGHLFDTSILHDERNSLMSDTRPPPTSRRILSSLPSIPVTDQELLVQQNKDCCICCAEYTVGEMVIQLPCDHIFHHYCIHEWLGSRNTCPMCRWELETDDPFFEQGRIERMKLRNAEMITEVSDSRS